MSIYEVIKDCISVAQKADNLPLVEKLIEAQKQILDLQNENDNLKRENAELKEKKEKFKDIERHSDPYITLKSDVKKLIYCSRCFDKDEKLIQAKVNDDGRYVCPACNYAGYYDSNKYNGIKQSLKSDKTII